MVEIGFSAGTPLRHKIRGVVAMRSIPEQQLSKLSILSLSYSHLPTLPTINRISHFFFFRFGESSDLL